MPNIGDIYTVRIYFQGTSGPYKTRPILIINTDGVMYTIAEITSEGPKDPPTYYDQFKEKIKGWEKYGLDKESFVKCTNIHNISNARFINHIGSMDENEFEEIVDKISEANEN